MTARRTLSPAARGVVLAVRAALRAGRVDLADQADGSTLATSTAPDGIVLLHAVLRMPVPGAADPRQLTLPAVAPVPQPAEAPPAPVAVPAGEEREPEAPAPQGAEVRCWISELQWDDLAVRDEEGHGWVAEPVAGAELGWESFGTWVTAPVPAGFTWAAVDRNGFSVGEVERCLWREVDRLGDNRWRILPVDTETPSAKAKREKAAKPKRAKAAPKARPARLEEVPEADALTTPGTQTIVWQRAAGDPWELVWSSKTHGELTVSRAWELACEGHRARQYHRNGRCTRDSRDGAK